MYKDRWIECTDDAVRVRGYYFPWGTKCIRYAKVRSVRRVTLSTFWGKARLWGTANPRYWASLDPHRGSKHEGLVIDVGRFVRPFITPDDCAAVESTIRERAHLGPPDAQPGQAPVI